METRVDVFLFRVGFFESIYQARILCCYAKAVLKNRNSRLLGKTNLRPFEICSVRHYRFVQQRIIFLLQNEFITYIPGWINVTYTLMAAFLKGYPTNIGYPCKGLHKFSVSMFDKGY